MKDVKESVKCKSVLAMKNKKSTKNKEKISFNQNKQSKLKVIVFEDVYYYLFIV